MINDFTQYIHEGGLSAVTFYIIFQRFRFSFFLENFWTILSDPFFTYLWNAKFTFSSTCASDSFNVLFSVSFVIWKISRNKNVRMPGSLTSILLRKVKWNFFFLLFPFSSFCHQKVISRVKKKQLFFALIFTFLKL